MRDEYSVLDLWLRMSLAIYVFTRDDGMFNIYFDEMEKKINERIHLVNLTILQHRLTIIK
jgi:hypothetical protein